MVQCCCSPNQTETGAQVGAEWRGNRTSIDEENSKEEEEPEGPGWDAEMRVRV